MIATYSENIRAIRSQYGLTQEEFAEKIGVSVGVVTNLELARLKSPEKKMPLFRLISEKFDVPVEWILADDPGPLPPVGDRQKQDRALGEFADDPVVRSFLAFWQQRTDEERAVLQKAIDDFAETLKKNCP